MSSNPYRVGIIGCGGMGQAHARAYENHELTEVVAAVDPDEEARQHFAEAYEVDQTFEAHGPMLEEVDPDVVSVCTWHSTHAELTVEAAEHGVEGIFCEKPMCTNLGEAQAMIEAADRNDVVLTVGHQRRYDPVHEKARALVADGAVGEPRVVSTGHGDGLLNWGTHLVDLARYVLGDPETAWVVGQLERKTDRYERGVPVEDRCLGQVCFETGCRLTLEMDLPDPDLGERQIEIYGTGGSLRLRLGEEVTVTNEDGTETYAPEADVSSRFSYLDDMVGVMEGGEYEHRCSAYQAERTIEILMSIYESARTNSVVQTPLRTLANPLEHMIENGALPPEHPGEYDIRIPYRGIDDS